MESRASDPWFKMEARQAKAGQGSDAASLRGWTSSTKRSPVRRDRAVASGNGRWITNTLRSSTSRMAWPMLWPVLRGRSARRPPPIPVSAPCVPKPSMRPGIWHERAKLPRSSKTSMLCVQASKEPSRHQPSRLWVEIGSLAFRQAKTHFQHVFIAPAITVSRLLAWLDDVPFSSSRTYRFAALAP